MRLRCQFLRPSKMMEDTDAIERLAADILGYLAGEPDRMLRFFDLTGLNPSTLRQTAVEPSFAFSLLEYLTGDDRLLVAFANETGNDPTKINMIYQKLKPPVGGDA